MKILSNQSMEKFVEKVLSFTISYALIKFFH